MSDRLAFPCVTDSGLTKREWFAGMALAGFLSNQSLTDEAAVIARGVKVPRQCFVAQLCYEQADAMIAESERTGK